MGEEGIGGVASVQDIGLQQFHLNEDADVSIVVFWI